MITDFRPEKDITAYELAISLTIILCSPDELQRVKGLTPEEFAKKHGIERHFIFEKDD